MEAELFRFGHKAIRAAVIKEYMQGTYTKAVCFSCGNAAQALADAGVDVLHIGPKGVLEPRKWFTPQEIKAAFPHHFDATSGHLPIDLMQKIADAYRAHLGQLPARVLLPCGSGETLVCLKLAFPATAFTAVYNLDDATEYNAQAPLNKLVELLAEHVAFMPRDD